MRILKNILAKGWLQHLIFWMLSLYAVGSYFSISNYFKVIDFIYAGFFHIPLITLVYINLRYLIPNFLQKEKYFPFFLLGFFNLGFAYFLHEILFEVIIPLLPTDFYMVSFTDMSVLITIFSIYWAVTTLLKLSKSWYKLQQLEKEKLSLELNSLKMQINPHFLFNSLNSIYSMAMKKSDQTPKVILELSNLMRYMIYEVSDESVPLEREIEAINNYIDLQKIRMEPETEINFEVLLDDDQRKIAPLLFFPLIENSFKHGLKGEGKENFVEIHLKNTAHEINFNIRNNKGKVDEVEKNKFGGIGLENVEKRLALIYGEKATMGIKDEANTFEVNINIKWI